MITPSIIIITLIAAFLQNFAEFAVVRHAFNGIRAAVCVLVFNAVMKLAKKSVVDKVTLVICIAVLAVSLFTDISPAIMVVLAGGAGYLAKRLQRQGGEK